MVDRLNYRHRRRKNTCKSFPTGAFHISTLHVKTRTNMEAIPDAFSLFRFLFTLSPCLWSLWSGVAIIHISRCYQCVAASSDQASDKYLNKWIAQPVDIGQALFLHVFFPLCLCVCVRVSTRFVCVAAVFVCRGSAGRRHGQPQQSNELIDFNFRPALSARLALLKRSSIAGDKLVTLVPREVFLLLPNSSLRH